MEVKTLKSWEEFLDKIQEMREYQETKDFLFRGQSDASWPLGSTLERREKEYLAERYLNQVYSIASKIESLANRSWSLPTKNELMQEVNEKVNIDEIWYHLPMLGYLVYLRHHGYPSPLLDWTRSPFIAAWFAYIGINLQDTAPVAVYAIKKKKSFSLLDYDSVITFQKDNIKTHQRHYLQKTRFTVATRYDPQDSKLYFTEHGPYLEKRADTIKLILPAKDRIKVLAYLDDYNINHYSLFGSEDSLITTMAVNDFDLK